MKLNKDKWIANIQKVVAQTKWQPSSSKAIAFASVMTIKQGMFESLGGDKESPELKFVESELDELAKQIASGEELKGFCCNASAAAKAAGFKGKEEIMLADLGDLMKVD